MPPTDVALSERQRMVEHIVVQLQQLNQPSEKAKLMAQKVEEAAYIKASNKQEYMHYLQSSIQRAQLAQQRNAAALQAQQQQQQAAQQHAAQQQVVQQQQAAQQNAQAHALAQQQARQQQQQQVAVSHMSIQQQFMHQTPAAQQQQYVQQAPVQQQYMQQPAGQPQYVHQAPQQYMQQQAVAQPQYVQQPGPQQQQYLQQPTAAQQYVRPPAAVVVPQQPQQQQYVQQYVAQAAPQQQQYVQQGVQAPQQYMQQQAPQQQYMQQAPQQYVQQQGVQQPQYVQQQPGQQQFVQVQMPMQQVPGQQAVAQPQYVQQAGGGGYTVQQFTAAAPAPVQQQPAAGGAAAIQPRQLGAGEFARLPSFDDPAFAEFAADFLPDAGQAAVAVKAQPQQQQVGPQQQQQQQVGGQQQRFTPPQPQASAAESSAPGSALHAGSPAGAANSGSQARDASSAAQRKAHAHDPASLQEFLRLHAAFNNPQNRAVMIKDSERMLNWYQATAKSQPAYAERWGVKANRYGMILRLLQTEQAHQQISINDQVLKLTKGFIKEVANFKEMMRKSSQKQAAGATSGNSAPGNAPSPGGFLAMLESGESDAAMKLPAPFLGTTGTTGVKLEPTPAQATPAAAGPSSAAAEAARQQALARQRQLAEANAEAQRRREAAHAALPASGPPRLLAVAAQARGQQDAAAVQSGFQRLQQVLRAAEHRQLAPSQGGYQVQAVGTPPLPAEVQRLVARDRAALEEAAAEAPGGSRSGVTSVLTVAGEEGHVPAEQQGDAAGPPPAKRQRSASPEFGAGVGQQVQQAQQQARQKSELELRLAVECEEAGAALGGALLLHVTADSTDPHSALVTCLPKAARAAAPAAAAGPGSASGAGAKQKWQLLLLRVPPGYPQEAPTAVYCRNGQGGASEAQAAAAARSQQLLEACRERFAAALAAAGGVEPLRLHQIAQAWMGAIQQVETLAGGGANGEVQQ